MFLVNFICLLVGLFIYKFVHIFLSSTAQPVNSWPHLDKLPKTGSKSQYEHHAVLVKEINSIEKKKQR